MSSYTFQARDALAEGNFHNSKPNPPTLPLMCPVATTKLYKITETSEASTGVSLDQLSSDQAVKAQNRPHVQLNIKAN